MTESQQSERGWFSAWREQRRARRRQLIESRLPHHERGGESGRFGPHRRSAPFTYGAGGGWAATAAAAMAAAAADAGAQAVRRSCVTAAAPAVGASTSR